MKEDSQACQVMNKAIANKRNAPSEYIQLVTRFAPAIKRVAQWNKSRELKVTELLTVSDEAFLIVCLISYGPRWIVMHRNFAATKGRSNANEEELPVNTINAAL